jgi:hypothetical protein
LKSLRVGLSLLISKRLQLIIQWLFAIIGLVSEYFNHGSDVACKLLNGKMIEKVSAKGKIAKYKIWHFAMHITRKLPSPKLP